MTNLARARHELGLTASATSWTDGGTSTATERVVRFEDWTIDGTPLRQLLGWARPPQEMTPLSEDGFWPAVAVRHLRQLLGEEPGDFDDGRLAVLVCPIDADLGCSALSMRLSLHDDGIEWTHFGWQTNYEPFVDADRLELSFRFDRRNYESLIRSTLRRYSAQAQ